MQTRNEWLKGEENVVIAVPASYPPEQAKALLKQIGDLIAEFWPKHGVTTKDGMLKGRLGLAVFAGLSHAARLPQGSFAQLVEFYRVYLPTKMEVEAEFGPAREEDSVLLFAVINDWVVTTLNPEEQHDGNKAA